ncbi:MAG: glycosyltransferase family A protein [Pseudomonadota bacterium]
MLISVCMPCYNSARFLRDSIESVLAQDYPDYEIIVVNDESKDESRQILEDYAANGVKIIDQKNGGAATARNAAYRASVGDAVLFMDTDDLILPNHLSSLAARLTEPSVITMGQWDRFYSDPAEATFPVRETYRDAPGFDWIIEGGWGMMQSAMFLVPRKLIELYGPWNERRSPIDDMEFYTRIISRCSRLRFIPEARVFYRSGLDGSLSGGNSRVHVEGRLLSLIDATSHLLRVKDDPECRLFCANMLQRFHYDFYPYHPDLRAFARKRVSALGGATCEPSGSPKFQTLRKYVGWRMARRLQHAYRRG